MIKVVLKWKRPIGRPKQKWIDKVEKNLVDIGIQDGETVAQDRDRWKQVCATAMGLNGLQEAEEGDNLLILLYSNFTNLIFTGKLLK